MARRARVVTWNGKDLPPELRELPAGRYVVEALDDSIANEQAIQLLRLWVSEDSSGEDGGESWDELKKALDSDRTIGRRLFP